MTASPTTDAPPAHPIAGSVTPITAGAAAPDVEIIGVTKRFGDGHRRRRDGPLASRAARSTRSSGPSGCGKTTTLRMIAGFEQPTEGEILLAGQPIAGVPPYQRNVNTVFQHYALFPHMDVAQNVGYGLRQRKVAKAEEGRRVSRGACPRPAGRLRQAPDLGDVGRAAAAGRARAGAREPAHRPAPGRAARRARPQAAQGDAARAQGPPARGRDHVRVRDPRPGRGAHDERRHRGHARRPDPAAGRTRPSSTSGPVNRFVADFIGTSNFLPASVVSIDTATGRVAVRDRPRARSCAAASPTRTPTVVGR